VYAKEARMMNSEEIRLIELLGVDINTSEVRIKKELIGPFSDFDSAKVWLKAFKFREVVCPGGLVFIREGKSYLNRRDSSSRSVDIIWAKIICILNSPEKTNISEMKEPVRP
jgi:hypothetical protein